MADFDQSIAVHGEDHATIQDTEIAVDHDANSAFNHGVTHLTDQSFNHEHQDFDLVAVSGFDQASNQGLDHTAGQDFDHTAVHSFDHVAGQGYDYSADHSFDNVGGHDFNSTEGQRFDNAEAQSFNNTEEQSFNHSIDPGLAVEHVAEEGAEPNEDPTLGDTVDDSANQAPENIEAQEKQGHDESGQKRWPGWPGESVFRLLVPAQKVGSIIGRKGEFIKKLVEETRARIKILDGPPGTTERAVIISAKEEPDSALPPAVDGLLRIHKRLVEGLENDSSAKISLKLLVPQSQAGILIGKQGGTVKSIQETAGCMVRVIPTDLPIFALQDDRVVELLGEPSSVQKALEIIASHLRKFLVDRTVIPLFEMTTQMSNPQMEHVPPAHQAWGPPQGLPPNAGGGPGFGHTPQYMPPPPQLGNYYPPAPPAKLPPPMEKQPHQGISAYGREVPIHASSNAQAAPSMITQITQQMQIPLSYADAVIGTAGANISFIRRASGATVTIQETRGVPNEMTVEISGSSSEVQAAQQLIQNFMAEAAAPGQLQSTTSVDQAYNPYAAYSSPASNPSHAGHTGYGSTYGTNYGY